MTDSPIITLPPVAAIRVTAVVDDAAQRPQVELSWPLDDDTLRLDPRQAEQLAMELLRAARAAEMDAFLLGWMLNSGMFHAADARTLLDHFQQWRTRRLRPRPRADRQGKPS